MRRADSIQGKNLVLPLTSNDRKGSQGSLRGAFSFFFNLYKNTICRLELSAVLMQIINLVGA